MSFAPFQTSAASTKGTVTAFYYDSTNGRNYSVYCAAASSSCNSCTSAYFDCQVIACKPSAPRCNYFDLQVNQGSRVIKTVGAKGNGSSPSFMALNPRNNELYMAGWTQCPLCAPPTRSYLYVMAFSISKNTFVKTISLGVYTNDSLGDQGQLVSSLTYSARSITAVVCLWNDGGNDYHVTYVINGANQIVSEIMTPVDYTAC